MRPWRTIPLVCLAVLLTACAAPPRAPLTLPPADGRASDVSIGDGFAYVVNLQALERAEGGLVLRVTRAVSPELTYYDGMTAKSVAESYCAGFNRRLNPAALGSFSTPASWVFEGGCL